MGMSIVSFAIILSRKQHRMRAWSILKASRYTYEDESEFDSHRPQLIGDLDRKETLHRTNALSAEYWIVFLLASSMLPAFPPRSRNADNVAELCCPA